ncbi:MAG: putative membrane protein YecN with MAPEG domain [Reinekea sp.]
MALARTNERLCMLPVTSIIAALAVVLYITLAARVIAVRRTNKVSLGDAADKVLETRIRQHGNFNEYVPLALILMVIAELQGAPKALLLALGVAILGGRLAHVFGLENMHKAIGIKIRTYGMISTFLSLIILSVTLVIQTVF